MPENFTLTLLSRQDFNDQTTHLAFSIENNQPLELVAGQFIRLLFDQDGEEVFRSYSVANILKSNIDSIEQIELAVSWVEGGLATVNLTQMNIGDSIKASAPYGRFCLTDKKWGRYFLVATGTGVTPYRAMTNELIQRTKEGAEVFVVMGAREASGLLYAEEFRACTENPGYHYITCLSRSQLKNPGKFDYQGHVQTFLNTNNFNQETDIVFLCGNPEMVDGAFSLLKDAGMPVQQIRREKYVSPPIRKKKTAFKIKN